MNDSRKLLKHAFILDLLCLVLCFALLFLGTKAKLSTPVWMLFVGTLIALVALIASIVLFVKARKLDRAESKRIEQEILENAAKEHLDYVWPECKVMFKIKIQDDLKLDVFVVDENEVFSDPNGLSCFSFLSSINDVTSIHDYRNVAPMIISATDGIWTVKGERFCLRLI